MGIVICKPFGFEAMSGHLSMRAFAEAAAGLGFPTLSFDYGGTGDSEDLAPGADQWEAWLQDVVAATQELQRCAGVERICLLGFRLGAALASMAASRCPQVQVLIAVAPVLNGRRYLRELRTFERAAGLAMHASSAAPIPSREMQLAGEGHMEVSGFFLNAKTMAALQEVDLLTMPAPPVSDALVVDRDDIPGASAWREALSATGVRTEYVALPGFVQMMMRPPNQALIPQAMIAATGEWLLRVPGAMDGSPPLSNGTLPGAAASSTSLVLRSSDGKVFREQPVLLRTDPLLFGVVTLPPEGEVRKRSVVLLNSGGDHHIGPRRLYVALARDWAEHGYVVFRMDLSGLGDSAAQPDQPRNEMFPIGAVDDIRAAVDYVRSQHAVSDVTLAGSCSGASHAVRAAIAGLPVQRTLLINPLIFFWKDGVVNPQEVQPWEVAHKPRAYLKQVFSAAAWRRLLFGDVSIWRVVQIYLNTPVMALQSRLRNLARALHIRFKDDLRWELKNLKARGVRIVFVFSHGDAGLRLLELQSGLSARELGELYCLRTIQDADHDFTRSRARAALEQVLSEELYAHPTGLRPPSRGDRDVLDDSSASRICVVAPPPKHR
jgi:alpha-beta hydrolase superfamily lysophospholipase